MTSIFNKEGPVSIYSFGNHGKKLAEYLIKNNIQIDFFIDIKAEPNQRILNIPCIKPEMVSEQNEQVIVAVFNRLSSPKKISQNLLQKGVKNIISYHQIPIYYPKALKKCFWHDPNDQLENHQKQLNQLKKLFSEGHSQQVLNQIINYRNTGDFKLHPEGDGIQNQYFNVHIPGWLKQEKIIMIDCGAYNGDTLESAKNHKIPLTTVHCFEPDQKNYQALLNNYKNEKQFECHFYLAATWSKNKKLYFQDENGEGSYVANEGKEIQAMAIDEVFQTTPYNFIKIDVEGADLETLKGASQTLTKMRPNIAVSLYHRPEDLWEIPLYLKNLLPNYHFYLRQHGECCLETVLYCVPE